MTRFPTLRSHGPSSHKMASAVVMLAIGLFAIGCLERGLKPVNPCTRSNVGEIINVTNVDKVDLLFMVDNSNSMTEEQTQLIRELPRMVNVLASGDRDADGMQDFNPVRSLHVGVISSDMGVQGNSVPTCARADFGDDGVLRSTARPTATCTTTTFPDGVFDFMPMGAQTPAEFAAEVGCVASIGTGGCGFEQQLEAVLKALSPSSPQTWTRGVGQFRDSAGNYVPPTFFGSTFGHAVGANSGFIREDSALAVILVTDEEDCSVNPTFGDVFNPSSGTYGSVDLNLRCFQFREVTHPVERYVDGLLSLRQNPNLLIFAGIVGVPVETVGMGYDAILAHPMMEERVDTAVGNRLVPSCNTANGIAFPPVRIVRTAAALDAAGASVTIQSICQDSFTGALDEIIAKIADALKGACLPRPLNTDAQGRVQCQVLETLPASGDTTTCDQLADRGREFLRMEDDGRQTCIISQVSRSEANTVPGWFYDDFQMDTITTCSMTNPTAQRISLSMIQAVTNSVLSLECLQTILPGSGTDVQLGTFCDPGATPGTDTNLCPNGRSPNRVEPLTCDPYQRTCQVDCTSTADCTTAGLLSYVCDDRTYAEVAGIDEPGISDAERARRQATIPAGRDGDVYGFCVNPTCSDR